MEESQRLQALKAAAEAASAELQKLQNSAAGFHEEAASLQTQIDNVGGEPLKKKKADVQHLQTVSHPLLHGII